MNIVNFRLLAHPFNWAIVWITLALAAMAYHLIHEGLAANPPVSVNDQQTG